MTKGEERFLCAIITLLVARLITWIIWVSMGVQETRANFNREKKAWQDNYQVLMDNYNKLTYRESILYYKNKE